MGTDRFINNKIIAGSVRLDEVHQPRHVLLEPGPGPGLGQQRALQRVRLPLQPLGRAVTSLSPHLRSTQPAVIVSRAVN